jgi:hypothetical protein
MNSSRLMGQFAEEEEEEEEEEECVRTLVCLIQ